MNEEEKIKNVEEILELCREELPYNEDISATLDCEDLESLECLYIMYKQEKEKNKKLEEQVKGFRDSYEESRIEECDTYFLMNKVIDMMATFIGNEDIDEKICKNVDECYRANEDGDYFLCKACIKEYYFKVAKGEEYKNKYCGGED